MATPARYQYEPLQQQRQIRLLRLKQGDEFDSVKISIFPVTFDDQLAYEALSYTWGDPAKVADIISNGDGDILPVTLNCEAALRRLRLKEDERILWIDAICIDQSNIEERNQQVRIMSTIYQQAQRVIAYLGEGSKETNLGMDFIIEDARSICRTGRPPVGLAPSFSSSPQQRAIDRILERPYFERIWILQEIVFAREMVVVLGDRTVDWRAFSTTVYYVDKNKKLHQGARYHQKPPKAVFYRDKATKFSTGQKSNTHKPDSLLEFLKDTRHCKSSDPRDKVYALLGMTLEKEDFILDYNVPTRDLFISLTKSFITRDRNLDVLCHAQGSHSTLNLPSWAPDWSHPRLADVLGHEKTVSIRPYKSALNTTTNVSFELDPHVLVTEGVPVDMVLQVGPMYNINDEISASTLHQWESIMQSVASSPTETKTAASRFIDTLIAYPTYQAFNPFAQFHCAWHKVTFGGQPPDALTTADTAQAAIFQEQLDKVCHGRCFFVTKRGYMGLGPPEIQANDMVAVLLGGSVPFLLHTVDEERFRLVGECYLHGFMNGEALGELGKEKRRMFRII